MSDDRYDIKRPSRVFIQLIQLVDIIKRYLEIETRKHDSNPTRYTVLAALRIKGEMSPTELSKWTYKSKHTITSMIDTLENKGLVKRTNKSDDRRSKKITLTKAGVRFSDELSPYAHTIGEYALSCLNEEELIALSKISKKIIEHLNKRV